MFMFITFMATLNMAMLLSLKFTLNKFNFLEIFSYWMLICAIIQQVFTIITMNLGMITITEAAGPFWYLIMNRLILCPSLIIWLLYFSKDTHVVHSTLLIGICCFALSCIQLLSKTFGMITFSKWTLAYSLAEWFTVILISFSFFLWFRNLLKKEGVIL